MPRFRQKPSSRRAPSPTAKQLITGPTIASDIKYGRRTTHLLPVKPSHHLRRFHDGQRLSLKAYVGGPTEAHVHVTSAERVPLRDVDYVTVRELGYVRLDQFRVTWVEEHDEAWTAKLLEEFPDHIDVGERFCRKEDRFDRRHAHREVWVIRFALDRMLPDRYMAQRSEEGYTDSAARGLKDEPPTLHEHEWKAHVYDNRDLSHEQWVALARDRARGPQRLPKHLRRAA
jgi:hypothetical protein